MISSNINILRNNVFAGRKRTDFVSGTDFKKIYTLISNRKGTFHEQREDMVLLIVVCLLYKDTFGN